MLSPGVFLALRSAEVVADAVTRFVDRHRSAAPAELGSALDAYAAAHAAMLTAWLELVDYFYDGRMLALLRSGHDWMHERSNILTCAMQQHIERRVALQASGMGTTSRYNRALLRWLGRYGLRGVQPADFAIR
jgi:hypothetical protein